MSYKFSNEYVDCVVEVQDEQLVINGVVKQFDSYDYAELVAANPIERGMSYNGSGLPFPCAQIAFEKTPNFKKITKESRGLFSVFFLYPNSYYTEDGFYRVPPSIFFILKSNNKSIDPMFIRFELPMDPILNLRTLTYRNRPREGPMTFAMKEAAIGICGAEETMRKYKDAKIFSDLV